MSIGTLRALQYVNLFEFASFSKRIMRENFTKKSVIYQFGEVFLCSIHYTKNEVFH